MKLRERVIDLSARITTLRAELDGKRAELTKIERELDALLTERPEATAPPSAVSAPPSNEQAGEHQSISVRIGVMLLEEPESEFDAELIHAQMPEVNLPSIRAALSRLVDEGLIERTRRGVYSAKTKAAA
jgi:Tfp pilus assembly protein FimV